MKRITLLALLAIMMCWNANATLSVISNPGPNTLVYPGATGVLFMPLQVTNNDLVETAVVTSFLFTAAGPTNGTLKNMVMYNSIGVPITGTLPIVAVANTLSLQTSIGPGSTQTFFVRVDIDNQACAVVCYDVWLDQVVAYNQSDNTPIITTSLPTHASGLCVTSALSTVSIDSVPETICQNTPFIPAWSSDWTSCEPLEVHWDFGNQASVHTWGNAPMPPVTFWQAGQHIIYLTVSNPVTGQIKQVADTINVYPTVFPNIWVNGTSQLDCMNDTVTLTTNSNSLLAGIQWLWNGNLVGTDSILHVTQPGQYTLELTSGNMCAFPQAQTIQITREEFLIDIVVNGQGATDTISICNNNQKNLSTFISGSSNNWMYNWSTGDITGWITVTSPGTYSVTVTNSTGCTASDMIVINQAPVQQISITSSDADNIACANEPITLTAPSGFTSYQWSSGYGSNTVSAWQSGNYTVTTTDVNGCTAVSNQIQVTINPAPQVYLLADVNYCALNAQPSTEIWYDWYMNDSLIAVNVGPYYNPTGTGWYNVEVTNTFGCKAVSQPIFMNCMTTGISENESEEVFSFYPNPTTDVLHVISISTFETILVTDITGKEVIKIQPTDAEETIETSALAAGVYILTGTTDGKHFSQRFVKQ